MSNELGLPGQYFDEESGLWQNWYRDYDQKTGRYVEGDLIGLSGGVNVYSYVEGNPILRIDPKGEVFIVPNPKKLLRCAQLRVDVIINCKTKWHDKSACKYTDDCSTLLEKIGLRFRCIQAQMELTRECYPDDPTHTQRLTDEIRAIRKCRDILNDKQCVACPR